MVRWLLTGVADPNPLNFRGKTPLDAALADGHVEIAEMLHENGGVESGKG